MDESTDTVSDTGVVVESAAAVDDPTKNGTELRPTPVAGMVDTGTRPTLAAGAVDAGVRPIPVDGAVDTDDST